MTAFLEIAFKYFLKGTLQSISKKSLVYFEMKCNAYITSSAEFSEEKKKSFSTQNFLHFFIIQFFHHRFPRIFPSAFIIRYLHIFMKKNYKKVNMNETR